jgi:hypothetical protein
MEDESIAMKEQLPAVLRRLRISWNGKSNIKV